MKILFITSSSINGGAQKHIREMFRSLSQGDNEVYIVAPSGWLLDELSNYSAHAYALEASVKNIKHLEELIDGIKPDVTNTFILSGGCFGMAAWKKKKYGKIFVTVNNPVIYDGISKVGKIVYPRLYRWMSKYASAFLVKADKVRDEVAEVINNKKPVISIKNGIDFSVFDKNAEYKDIRSPLGIRKGDIVVSNVAVLNERKGQQHLIEAAVELRNKYPIHVMLAGEGSYEAKLRQLIDSLNAGEFIHFLGRRSDVNCVLANSNIFALSSYHEGLPNALMEAMAMGLPCVATDVGGVRQLIDDGIDGIIVEPKFSKQIVEAIEMFLGDKTLMEKCGNSAYERMLKEYRQENVAKELKNIYLKY